MQVDPNVFPDKQHQLKSFSAHFHFWLLRLLHEAVIEQDWVLAKKANSAECLPVMVYPNITKFTSNRTFIYNVLKLTDPPTDNVENIL